MHIYSVWVDRVADTHVLNTLRISATYQNKYRVREEGVCELRASSRIRVYARKVA